MPLLLKFLKHTPLYLGDKGLKPVIPKYAPTILNKQLTQQVEPVVIVAKINYDRQVICCNKTPLAFLWKLLYKIDTETAKYQGIFYILLCKLSDSNDIAPGKQIGGEGELIGFFNIFWHFLRYQTNGNK